MTYGSIRTDWHKVLKRSGKKRADPAMKTNTEAWGTDTTTSGGSHTHSAENVSIEDVGTYYVSPDVEGALQEIGAGGIGGGASVLNIRGAYDSGTTYDTGDLVSYDGGSYVASHDGVVGITPVDGADWTQIAAPGEDGVDGVDGTDALAYTTLTNSFTQPASSSSVSVVVGDTNFMAVGEVVYVSGGGYYSVASITDATHASLTNLGYSVNTAAAATVGAGGKIVAGGVEGPSTGLGAFIDSNGDLIISDTYIDGSGDLQVAVT